MRIRNGFEEFFCLHSNLSKRVWILEVWSETDVENYIFRSEIGSGFEEPGSTPPSRIPRSTPPGGEGSTTVISKLLTII